MLNSLNPKIISPKVKAEASNSLELNAFGLENLDYFTNEPIERMCLFDEEFFSGPPALDLVVLVRPLVEPNRPLVEPNPLILVEILVEPNPLIIVEPNRPLVEPNPLILVEPNPLILVEPNPLILEIIEEGPAIQQEDPSGLLSFFFFFAKIYNFLKNFSLSMLCKMVKALFVR